MNQKLKQYDIHGKGVPKIHNVEELETALKTLATKETYDNLERLVRTGEPNSLAYKGTNSAHVTLSEKQVIKLIPILKKCFPSLLFRISGKFIYGPGDAIGEHTNADDPSDTLYITYATGESNFSYRFSLDEDFIHTPDVIDGITLRAFEITSKEPYTFHKIECESGYRVSIGLRYTDFDKTNI
jgi:hypothetical protein